MKEKDKGSAAVGICSHLNPKFTIYQIIIYGRIDQKHSKPKRSDH
jgi:hypothetical protein